MKPPLIIVIPNNSYVVINVIGTTESAKDYVGDWFSPSGQVVGVVKLKRNYGQTPTKGVYWCVIDTWNRYTYAAQYFECGRE